MIQVSRLSAPAHLKPANVARWHRNLCSLRAAYYLELAQVLQSNQRGQTSRQRVPPRPHANRDHFAHADVRTQLEVMFGSKCAYCESNVKHISPQHVEHYRPASHYPGLAYQWENLLLACAHCNSTYKKDRFPISPVGNTPKENHANPCSRTGRGEVPLLLNPCNDAPDQHLTFQNGRIVALSDQGRFTRRICGLNRQDLVDYRRLWLKFIRRSAEHYEAAKVEGNVAGLRKYTDELKEFVYEGSQYTAMARTELDMLGSNWRTL